MLVTLDTQGEVVGVRFHVVLNGSTAFGFLVFVVYLYYRSVWRLFGKLCLGELMFLLLDPV